MKKIVIILLFFAVWTSCEKPNVGFFSEDGIQTREDTMEIVRGIYQMSALPNVDGSTRPITFELVRVTNRATGEEAPEFLNRKYDISLWSKAYNATTDTTMELVNQKLVTSSENPLQINPFSGQLVFNSATTNIPGGIYSVDVRATNSKSSKVFVNFALVKLMVKPFQTPGVCGDYFVGISSDGKENPIKNFNPYSAAEMLQVADNKHPYRKLTKVANSDIVELELVLKDAEGTPFPPQAIERWWDAGNNWFYNSYHDNSLPIAGATDKVTYTDTSCIFRFPTLPYPAFGSSYNSGDNLFLTYYNISNKYWKLTDEYQQIANAMGVIYPSYQVRFKNSYKINEPGKWLMEVKSRYVIYTKK